MKKTSLVIALSLALGLLACEAASDHAVAAAPSLSSVAPVVAAQAPLVTGLPDFTALVEREGRAVVNISTTQVIRRQQQPGFNGEDPFELFRRFGFPVPPRGQVQPREQRAQSLGSGFIVESSGIILTNAHVVADAEEVTVKLTDKREFKAKILGSDARADVAVLKIEASGLPTVDLGSSSKLRVGEWVVAIGSPFGMENSVSAGIVSAKGRDLQEESDVPMIQTDAAVNPGNSGGPLFNVRGEVIGINSQIFSRSGGFMGLSFAIPIDTAMDIVKQLKAEGKVTRGRIGVGVQDMNEDLWRAFGLKQKQGALVSNVEPDGPGAKAGLKAGDVILKFNGMPVNEMTDLPKAVRATKPGSTAPLEIWRNKASKIVNITVAELEAPPQDRTNQSETPRKNKGESMNRSGLMVRDVDPRLLKQLGVRFALQVTASQGAAAQAGVQPGDFIVGIAGEELKSFEQLEELLNQAKPNSSLPLRIRRGEASLFVSLKLGDKSEK